MKGYFRRRGCICKDKKKCKCGAKWSFTIDLGKDEFNQRKQKTISGFKTKAEAESACRSLIMELEKNQYIEPSKMDLEKFLKQWLDTKKTNIKQTTFNKYNSLIVNHIIPNIGNVKISKLTPMKISSFYNSLTNKLSLTTISDIHAVLKNALEQAVRWELISKNVAALVDKPKSDKKQIKVWDIDESQKFLKIAKKNNYYIAFLLALITGMRQGEILGLRWKDVDFIEKTISIIQTLSHDGKSFNNQAKTSTGNRLITIDDSTLAEIKNHRKKMIEEQLEAKEYIDNGLVIATSKGTPLSPRNLLRTFYKLIDVAEVSKISFHDLRHTHATMLLKQGVNPKIVAERLGHSNVRTTLDTYSHILPNMQKDTATQFAKMFYAE